MLMLQLFHQFHLFNTAFTLLHVGHVKDLKQFERNKLPSDLIERLKDKGELALAYGLHYLVVSITSAIKFTISYGDYSSLFWCFSLVGKGIYDFILH
jgi:hypothetical protein